MAKLSLHPTTEVPPSIYRKPLDTYQTFPAQEQEPTRIPFLVLPRIEGRYERNKQSLFLHQLPEDILLAIAGWGLQWNKSDMQGLTNTCYRFATIFAPLRYKRYKDIGDTMMKAAIMATYSSIRPADGNRKVDPRLGTLVPFVERLFFVAAGIADEYLLADIFYCRSIGKIRWLDQEWEEVTEEPDHKKVFCLHGITAMGVAAACGHWEIVRAILGNYLANGLSDGNRPVCRCTRITPLHLAVEKDILLLHNNRLATLFIGKSGQYPTTSISPKYPASMGHRRRMCVRQLMKADASPWRHGKCSAHPHSLSFNSIDLAKAPSNSGPVCVQKTAELLHNHIKQLLRREKARISRAIYKTQCWINSRLPGLQYRPAPPPVVLSEENQPLITDSQSRYPGLTRTCSVAPVSVAPKVPEGVKHLRTVIDKVEEWHYSPTDTKMPPVSLEPTPRGPHHLNEAKARAPGHAPSNYLPKAAAVYFVAPSLWLIAQASAISVAQSLSDQGGITIEGPPAVTVIEDQSPLESKSIVAAKRILGQSSVLPERFPHNGGRTTSQEDLHIGARSLRTVATIPLDDWNKQSSEGLSPLYQPDNQCWTLPNIDILEAPFYAFTCIDSLRSPLGSDTSAESRPGDATNDSDARPIFVDDLVVEQRASPGFGLDSRLRESTEKATTVHILTPAASIECLAGASFSARVECVLRSTEPARGSLQCHVGSGAAQQGHRDDKRRLPGGTPVYSVPLETSGQKGPGEGATPSKASINEPIIEGDSGEIFWSEAENSFSISRMCPGVRNPEVLPDEESEAPPTAGQLAKRGTQSTGTVEPKLGCKILCQERNAVPGVRMVALPSPSVQGDQLNNDRLAKEPLGKFATAKKALRKEDRTWPWIAGGWENYFMVRSRTFEVRRDNLMSFTSDIERMAWSDLDPELHLCVV